MRPCVSVFSITSASWIAGRESLKCTSTTGPMISVMTPFILLVLFILLNGERFASAHDLRHFTRDACLADLIEEPLQVMRHLFRLIRCVLHRYHARRVL